MSVGTRSNREGGDPVWDAMPLPPLHPREEERLAVMEGLRPFFESNDPLMERIARRAAEISGVSSAQVTLIEAHEQRFLASTGGDFGEATPRNAAFCAYTILEDEPLVVEDALQDRRFRHNPFVEGDPHVRFYVGAPIVDAHGLPLGSVCAVDDAPRRLSSKRLLALARLARTASAVVQARQLIDTTCGPYAPASHLTRAHADLEELLKDLVLTDETRVDVVR